MTGLLWSRQGRSLRARCCGWQALMVLTVQMPAEIPQFRVLDKVCVQARCWQNVPSRSRQSKALSVSGQVNWAIEASQTPGPFEGSPLSFGQLPLGMGRNDQLALLVDHPAERILLDLIPLIMNKGTRTGIVLKSRMERVCHVICASEVLAPILKQGAEGAVHSRFVSRPAECERLFFTSTAVEQRCRLPGGTTKCPRNTPEFSFQFAMQFLFELPCVSFSSFDGVRSWPI